MCTYLSDVLVSSIRPVGRFADLTSEEVTDLFLCVQRVSVDLQQAYSGTALTIAMQDGRDAGQSVEHVHVHILPRKPGDIVPNDDIYKKVCVWEVGGGGGGGGVVQTFLEYTVVNFTRFICNVIT